MPAVVQHRSTFSNGTTSIALPFSSNNAAGNLLAYATGGGQLSGSSNNAATDSNSNTIVNAINLASASGTGSVRWDYVANSNSGANTVTAHSTASLDLHIHIWEISGCVTVTPLRTSGSVHSTTGSVSTSASTPLAGDAVLAFFFDNPANDALTAGSGYSPSDLSSNGTGGDAGISEYASAASSGTQTATAGGNGAHNLDQAIVVFIQAASTFNLDEDFWRGPLPPPIDPNIILWQ